MRSLHRLPKPALFALGLGLLACVSEADRLLPPQASASVFYLLPIGFVSWFCGDAWAYGMAAACAGAWFLCDLETGPRYSHPFIGYWNALAHLALFAVVAAMSGFIARLRRLKDQEHAMSELKSSLVSLVSHEFGNSLTSLKLSLTILKESDGDDKAAERQTCYAILDRVYTHLNGSVANFLNLNRIEAGRFVPRAQPTHLRTLVHATVSQMGPLIEKSGVALRLDFPDHSVLVKTDPDALSVIMSNLIGNAFKYTPAGGAVTLRIKEDRADSALVAVEDTGIGIPKADRPMISSGYYRTENGKRAAMGFGVGLKVTRQLLESQGAALDIESAPGHGSIFSFRMPLWNEQRDAAGGRRAPFQDWNELGREKPPLPPGEKGPFR